MGYTTGQRVSLHNHTPFVLHFQFMEERCGVSEDHPTEIKPQRPKIDECEGLSYLHNRGSTGSMYGSDMVYTYKFVNTPDKGEWLLRIWSIGAYYYYKTCFAAQVIQKWISSEDFALLDASNADSLGETRAQVTWRDPTKHSKSNPTPKKDGNEPDCHFTLAVLGEPEKFPEGGSNFSKVELKIGTKPLEVSGLIAGAEELTMSHKETVTLKLLPDGKNSIAFESTVDVNRGIRKKTDTKWGQEYKYSEYFDWGVSFGAEKMVNVGEKSSAGVKVEEASSANEYAMSTELEKRIYKWSYTRDTSQEPEKVSMTITKKIYRQDIKWGDIVVGHKERYEYEYDPLVLQCPQGTHWGRPLCPL